jgi:hypothetical protein
VFAFTLVDLPVTLDLRASYAASGVTTLAVLGAAATFAFVTATAGRSGRGGVERIRDVPLSP